MPDTYGSGVYGAGNYGAADPAATSSSTAKPSWPTVTHQINTTADPNDPAATNTWVDVNATQRRVLAWSSKRGRSDELSDVQAGTLDWTLDNGDGRFDPTNSASDLYPYLLPNRQARTTATWLGVTYPIAFGYEEKGWPLTYVSGGRRGVCSPTFVDAITPLGFVGLTDVTTSEMLKDAPGVLFPLSEAGGNKVTSVTGNKASVVTLTGVSGTATLGATTHLPVSGTTALGMSLTYYGSYAGLPAYTVPGFTAVSSLSAFTLEAWVTIGQSNDIIDQLFTVSNGGTASQMRLRSYLGQLVMDVTSSTGGSTTNEVTGPAVNVNDGMPHHIVAVIGGGSQTLYVDGVAGPTSTYTYWSAGSANFTTVANLPQNGYATSFSGSTATVVMSMVAVYPTGLSAARIQAHYQAGVLGGAGDTVGQRVNRILDYIAWLPGLRSIDLTSSGEMDAKLQAVDSSFSGSSALNELQSAVDSANGLLDVDATGNVRYRSRDYKSLQTAPVVTFGEMAGEVPYLDDIAFDVDPNFLYAVVENEQANGVNILRSDATAVLRFFGRTLTKQTQLADVGLVADMADMLLRYYKAGQTRVSKLTVDPAANPSLWPQVLSLDYGMRVRVNRRQAGAPTKTVDCYIEGIQHDVTSDKWQMSFLLSPVPSLQGWVLGDSTFGVLGSTTIPVA